MKIGRCFGLCAFSRFVDMKREIEKRYKKRRGREGRNERGDAVAGRTERKRVIKTDGTLGMSSVGNASGCGSRTLSTIPGGATGAHSI